MVRRTFYLPIELDRELRRIAKEDGVSISSLVREGVDLVIKKYKKRTS